MPRKATSTLKPNSDTEEPSSSRRRVRKSNFNNNDDFVYELPTPKKGKKTESKATEEATDSKKENPKPKVKSNSVPKKTTTDEDPEIVPAFLEPFKFGWKREVVIPANNDEKKIEVYYYTPNGKKLRTNIDISANLTNNLTLDNFTKMKKRITNDNSHETLRQIVPKNKKEDENKQNETTNQVPKSRKRKGDATINQEKKENDKQEPEKEKRKETKSKTEIAPEKSSKVVKKKVTEEQEKVEVTSLNVKPVIEERPKRKITPKFPKGASPSPSTPVTPSVVKKPVQNTPIAITNGTTEKSPKGAPPKVNKLQEKTKISKEPEKKAPKLKITEVPDVPLIPPKRAKKELKPPPPVTLSSQFGQAANAFLVLKKTFSHLSFIDLLKASNVCQMWRCIAFNENLWHTQSLTNVKIFDLNCFLDILRQHNIRIFEMGNVRFDHFGDRIPKMNLNIEQLKITDCKNKTAEILMRQNFPRIQKLELRNITGECDFSQIGDFGNLKALELSGVSIKPSSFPLKKFESVEKLALFNLDNNSVYEEISKLSDTLLELTMSTVHNRQLASTLLLGFVNLKTLNLENIESHTNELLQTTKQMRNIQKLTLTNFVVSFNFDLYLSQCTNLNELVIRKHVTTLKPQIVNFLIIFGMLKLNLNSFEWIIDTKDNEKGGILLRKSTIMDNIKEIVKRFDNLNPDEFGILSEEAKVDRAKKVFGIEEKTQEEFNMDPVVLGKNLKEVLKFTNIAIKHC